MMTAPSPESPMMTVPSPESLTVPSPESPTVTSLLPQSPTMTYPSPESPTVTSSISVQVAPTRKHVSAQLYFPSLVLAHRPSLSSPTETKKTTASLPTLHNQDAEITMG